MRRVSKDFSELTVQDCIELYEWQGLCTELNDGAVSCIREEYGREKEREVREH